MDATLFDNLIRLGMAVLMGGLIGAEREFQDKAAGFRTIILITVGSTLFTIFSVSMDPGFTRTRIAANIVTGIGFLGAGAIIREGGRIAGLTTAATIWLSAALGMGIGAGDLTFVVMATGVVLVVLLLFPRLERWIDRIRETRKYKITLDPQHSDGLEAIQKALATCSLKIVEKHLTKTEKAIVSTWQAIGSPRNHNKFVEAILHNQHVKELDY
jgi:putative Mg2+ transporter-C (MgtC) family protein